MDFHSALSNREKTVSSRTIVDRRTRDFFAEVTTCMVNLALKDLLSLAELNSSPCVLPRIHTRTPVYRLIPAATRSSTDACRSETKEPPSVSSIVDCCSSDARTTAPPLMTVRTVPAIVPHRSPRRSPPRAPKDDDFSSHSNSSQGITDVSASVPLMPHVPSEDLLRDLHWTRLVICPKPSCCETIHKISPQAVDIVDMVAVVNKQQMYLECLSKTSVEMVWSCTAITVNRISVLLSNA
ncbi:hypothetical protein F2P81_016286 [Scophthalmus maximus]|uniref:Uncharacterized protein n=1 Tax=Scophthalmus maximus TaxID=52904 RepID=A0A6A4SKR8_SCOMX|nr:hypothetical protein F2P81_016286 [Scophthalmus maximus]